MKRHRILGYGLLVLVVGFVASCSQQVGRAPAYAPPESNLEAGDMMAVNAPKPQRTGIATGWGREMESRLTYKPFVRAVDKPRGISIIRYNGLEGAKAMGVNRKFQQPGMKTAVNDLVEWGMSSRFGDLNHYWWRDERFVIGKKDREYQIQVRNLSDARLEVVLSVDGLDVMDGKPASVKRRGYLIAPGKKLVVRGFRTSEEKVATFKFSSVENSYANLRHGNPRNVGVVGLAVFTEKGNEPGIEGRVRGQARAFAEAPLVQGR